MSDFEEEFDEKDKLKGDVRIPRKVLIARTLAYIKPEWVRFFVALLLIFANVGMDVCLPRFTKEITDNLSSGHPVLREILILVIAYFLISLVSNVFIFFESMILQRAGQNIILTLRRDVFTHIEGMSQKQFTEMPVGSLVTRVTSYTQSMSDLFTDVVVQVLRNVMTVVGVYILMFFINWKLSLLLFLPVTVVFITSFVFSKAVGKRFREERKDISDLNAFLNENLSGMNVTQLFCREEKKLAEFDEKNQKLRKAHFNIVKLFGLYRPFVTFIKIASVAAIFYFGVRLDISPGGIVAFYLYLGKFFNPIQTLADQLNQIQKALSASERLFNLMDVRPEVRDTEDAVDLKNVQGKIEFRHVWFAYEGEDWILKDVSFTVEPGQTCAFVGATGAGKTTVLGLIVRNYEIQKGQILIDGKDISRVRIKSLRKAVGQMLQDVFLFSGTVRTNITLHDETVTEERMKEACTYVGADKFIEKLPNGYDEEVIERGENFSQGQRQLLSFARTVLHDPKILILDEATANIDTESEVLIQESLEKIRGIGTMLVVAHRLSTIQHADNIIVIRDGTVAESGSHQELLARHGYYYKLYQLQFENRE